MFEDNKESFKAINYIQTWETQKSIYKAANCFLPNSYTPKINHLQLSQNDMENIICP